MLLPGSALVFNAGKETGSLPPDLCYPCLCLSLIVVLLLQIKTQKRYVWGKRESTEEGTPLGEVVEQVRNNNGSCLCLTFC